MLPLNYFETVRYRFDNGVVVGCALRQAGNAGLAVYWAPSLFTPSLDHTVRESPVLAIQAEFQSCSSMNRLAFSIGVARAVYSHNCGRKKLNTFCGTNVHFGTLALVVGYPLRSKREHRC
jgi:hypothetical protein